MIRDKIDDVPNVILCDINGVRMGCVDRIDAHQSPGKLHLAFSVFVFRNNQKETLIQKRSTKKRLFGDLWTNTCCSHPHEGERTNEAAQRRLKEELGFTCPLREVRSFIYRAEDPKGNGVEHEYDVVLIGEMEENIAPQPNPEEIEDWKWISTLELQEDLKNNPEKYTPWFAQALEVALQ